jgi:hypothetical protein
MKDEGVVVLLGLTHCGGVEHEEKKKGISVREDTFL